MRGELFMGGIGAGRFDAGTGGDGPAAATREAPAAARRLGRWESFWIDAAALVAFLGVWTLRRTTRCEYVGAADVRERVRRGERVIVAFWRDHLLGMSIASAGGPVRLLISWHRDGEIAVRCLRRFGMVSVRGSSTRGGIGGVRRLLEALRAGHPIVVVPDGPRGPRHRAKPGVVQLARASGAEIVPVGFAASRVLRAASWDRLVVPLPFARLLFVQGRSLTVPRGASAGDTERARQALESELERLDGEARGLLAHAGADRTGRALAAGYAAIARATAAAAGAIARVSGGRAWHLRERLGGDGPAVRRCVGARPSVWLHAASVGELEGVRAILPLLRARCPEYAIVVSAMTATGVEVARGLAGVEAVMFFPLDAPAVVRRALDAVRPALFAFGETEIWPGFLAECRRRGIPCVMLSARMSARSARRYRLVRPLLRRALAEVTACAQSAEDADRLIEFGVSAARAQVTGNLKADAPVDEGVRARARRVLAPVDGGARRLLIGASTHDGEEAALCAAFFRIPGSAFRLLLAPRHPERFLAVARALDDAAGPWVRFSDLETGVRRYADEPVILLDTIGVLRTCFGMARIAFVGGTLVPVGGHNPLEPAADGCAVLFGPHVDHVREMAHALVEAGGARQVADAEDLARALQSLAADAAGMAAMGERAREFAATRRGAAARQVAILLAALGTAEGTRL
jgi:3-deoxy-D-manno-octulosonic-acid transferase